MSRHRRGLPYRWWTSDGFAFIVGGGTIALCLVVLLANWGVL